MKTVCCATFHRRVLCEASDFAASLTSKAWPELKHDSEAHSNTQRLRARAHAYAFLTCLFQLNRGAKPRWNEIFGTEAGLEERPVWGTLSILPLVLTYATFAPKGQHLSSLSERNSGGDPKECSFEHELKWEDERMNAFERTFDQFDLARRGVCFNHLPHKNNQVRQCIHSHSCKAQASFCRVVGLDASWWPNLYSAWVESSKPKTLSSSVTRCNRWHVVWVWRCRQRLLMGTTATSATGWVGATGSRSKVPSGPSLQHLQFCTQCTVVEVVETQMVKTVAPHHLHRLHLRRIKTLMSIWAAQAPLWL